MRDDDGGDAKKAELLLRLADTHEKVYGPSDCLLPAALRAGAVSLAAGSRGPAQVATPAYRAHYDTIFGRAAMPEA